MLVYECFYCRKPIAGRVEFDHPTAGRNETSHGLHEGRCDVEYRRAYGWLADSPNIPRNVAEGLVREASGE
jgi:hypothetical protein